MAAGAPQDAPRPGAPGGAHDARNGGAAVPAGPLLPHGVGRSAGVGGGPGVENGAGALRNRLHRAAARRGQEDAAPASPLRPENDRLRLPGQGRDGGPVQGVKAAAQLSRVRRAIVQARQGDGELRLNGAAAPVLQRHAGAESPVAVEGREKLSLGVDAGGPRQPKAALIPSQVAGPAAGKLQRLAKPRTVTPLRSRECAHQAPPSLLLGPEEAGSQQELPTGRQLLYHRFPRPGRVSPHGLAARCRAALRPRR